LQNILGVRRVPHRMVLCSQGQPVVRYRYGKSCEADKVFSQNSKIFLVLSKREKLVCNELSKEKVNRLTNTKHHHERSILMAVW
jgi:hypothetical protein